MSNTYSSAPQTQSIRHSSNIAGYQLTSLVTSLVAGVDIRMVSERLGHSSILATSQTYQHVRKGMQADAAQKVADLIFGSTPDL